MPLPSGRTTSHRTTSGRSRSSSRRASVIEAARRTENPSSSTSVASARSVSGSSSTTIASALPLRCSGSRAMPVFTVIRSSAPGTEPTRIAATGDPRRPSSSNRPLVRNTEAIPGQDLQRAWLPPRMFTGGSRIEAGEEARMVNEAVVPWPGSVGVDPQPTAELAHRLGREHDPDLLAHHHRRGRRLVRPDRLLDRALDRGQADAVVGNVDPPLAPPAAGSDPDLDPALMLRAVGVLDRVGDQVEEGQPDLGGIDRDLGQRRRDPELDLAARQVPRSSRSSSSISSIGCRRTSAGSSRAWARATEETSATESSSCLRLSSSTSSSSRFCSSGESR